ncbi:hypothetical protein ES703_122969 [subsurface metagenome]
MKEIMNEILQAERKVEETLQKAREKAAEIKLQAEKNASQKIEEARRKAKEFFLAGVEEAKQKAMRIRDGKLKKAEEESEEIRSSNRIIIENLIQEIVRLVIQTVYDEKGSS